MKNMQKSHLLAYPLAATVNRESLVHFSIQRQDLPGGSFKSWSLVNTEWSYSDIRMIIFVSVEQVSGGLWKNTAHDCLVKVGHVR